MIRISSKDLKRAEKALASGNCREAIGILGVSAAKNPRQFEVQFLLGCALQNVGEHQVALKVLNIATRIEPSHAGAHNNIGLSHLALGQPFEAAQSFYRSTELSPNGFEGWANLGNALRTSGDLEGAAGAYKKALALQPQNSDVHRLYLLSRLYEPGLDAAEFFKEQKEFERRHAVPLYKQQKPHRIEPLENRRLRIGYVSSDFRDHPVGHNVAPLIFNHDRERFEVFLYAEVSAIDEMTDAFQKNADHWVPTVGMSDKQVADKIRKDKIDVLVFLAGHLDRNRLLVAAHKPAPVQVSFHDVCSSGLEAMDYWLTDSYLHPPDTAEPFTEKLVRLPHFYAYLPIEEAPDVSPPPYLERGYVTFGSFNNPAKLNDEVLDLWAQVLRAVPDSRLRLAYTGAYSSEEARERILEKMREGGVVASRVSFDSTRRTRPEHLARYSEIDVALDPFPFNGATTTFEALWMGVPVVTLEGERFVSRAAGSILNATGKSYWIAKDKKGYCEIASTLAFKVRENNSAREDQRRCVLASSLVAGRVYADTIGEAFGKIFLELPQSS